MPLKVVYNGIFKGLTIIKVFCFVYAVIPFASLIILNSLNVYRIKKSNSIDHKNTSREQTSKRNEKMTVIIIFLTVFFLPVVIVTLFISYSKNIKQESIGIKHLKSFILFNSNLKIQMFF
jgi:hypothetical protein